jgi:hypothetical protein
VVALVEALHYKPEAYRFSFQWCYWNFPLTAFRLHYGPAVDTASNRNKHQKYFLRSKSGQCIGPTTSPPSSAVKESGSINTQGMSRAVQGLLLKEDINTWFQHILEDKVPYVISMIQIWKMLRFVEGGRNGNKLTS